MAKHTVKITLILLAMFFTAQIIGLYVAHAYTPETLSILNQSSGNYQNETNYFLPSALVPPPETTPQTSVTSLLISLVLAVIIMLLLMKFRAETFLRVWFFVVITLGIAIGINAFILKIDNSIILALAIAFPLAYIKVFKRHLIVHNLTELIIYPGLAVIFILFLSKIWAVVLFLIIISIYDIWAVWHAGFMQKMAKYQIEKLRLFSGFFVPYISRKERELMRKAKGKSRKIKAHIAILGGGDVIFPIILAGVVLRTLGLWQALLISIGATIALAILFYFSEKGKFYPAMPFITAGCFIGLGLGYLL